MNATSSEKVIVDVEYEYGDKYEDGTKYPLYDIITKDYKAFLDYDPEFFTEMLRQLKRIKLRYRILSFSRASLRDYYIECHAWVGFALA